MDINNLEKLLPFMIIPDIGNAIALLEAGELDKALPLINKYFPLKITYENVHQERENIITLKPYQILTKKPKDSNVDKDAKIIVYEYRNTRYILHLKDIRNWQILKSPVLFLEKEDLLEFCDEKYIKNSGIDIVWNRYKEVIDKQYKDVFLFNVLAIYYPASVRNFINTSKMEYDRYYKIKDFEVRQTADCIYLYTTRYIQTLFSRGYILNSKFALLFA